MPQGAMKAEPIAIPGSAGRDVLHRRLPRDQAESQMFVSTADDLRLR